MQVQLGLLRKLEFLEYSLMKLPLKHIFCTFTTLFIACLYLLYSSQIPSPKDISDEQLQTLLQSGDAINYRVPLSLGEPHTEKDNGIYI